MLSSATVLVFSLVFSMQAVEAAQLAEDLKVQLEHVQCKLKEIQTCMAENRAAKEKESFNLKRAQVSCERTRALSGMLCKCSTQF